jgi:hypothetical protein
VTFRAPPLRSVKMISVPRVRRYLLRVDPTIVERHARRDDEPASDLCSQKVERVVVEGIEDVLYERFSSHANYQHLQFD